MIQALSKRGGRRFGFLGFLLLLFLLIRHDFGLKKLEGEKKGKAGLSQWIQKIGCTTVKKGSIS